MCLRHYHKNTVFVSATVDPKAPEFPVYYGTFLAGAREVYRLVFTRIPCSAAAATGRERTNHTTQRCLPFSVSAAG